MPTTLVTGTAGFIGYHLAEALLARGDRVVGVDVVNDYYDVRLKEARLERLGRHPGFSLHRVDLADGVGLRAVFRTHEPSKVVNLAAQAGVRYSIENPAAYVQSNLVGFANVLECCRHEGIEHLVYASSSSVYGANTMMPFSVHQNVDHPLSLYAATKKSNELMAHSYSSMFGLPTTGLRFFTVYGPWGRPDMALFLFAKAILEGRPIEVFNEGRMRRDFTYVDDVVSGIVRVLDKTATPNPNWSGDAPDPATSRAPYRVFDIGNNEPVELMRMIEIIEERLGRKAQKRMLPMQLGDVPATYANVDALAEWVGFRPSTPIDVGIGRFLDWYLDFYGEAR